MIRNEPRTKMVSATFTTEELAAIELAATQTDRTPAGIVRWSTIKFLRDLALLPYPGEDYAEYEEDEEDCKYE